ncbi:DDE_3 domain-containing protein [Trichonephila clavipes]|nr:DDE_3 domain-containing protein [Trichonephila clavipes]
MPGWNCTRALWLSRSLGCFFVALFGIFGSCTNLPQCNSVRRVAERSPPSVYAVLLSARNGVFQQDNCTFHKSRLATGWLDEHSSDFSVINWPPRSPDLNPIEHLWDVLEQGVKGHHTSLLNYEQF